jgi:hypothetical protein
LAKNVSNRRDLRAALKIQHSAGPWRAYGVLAEYCIAFDWGAKGSSWATTCSYNAREGYGLNFADATYRYFTPGS